jgi:thioredoxin-related protein
MRKLISILAFITGSLIIVSGQVAEVKVKWYTIKEAQELQKKEPRKIMIDVFTDWCGWCKRMDKETFSHPTIAAYLNSHFYPVKFNAESFDPIEYNGKKYVNEGGGQRSTHQFAVMLLNGQLSYPSVAYVDEKLQLLGTVPGYLTAIQIEPLLNFIVEDKYKSITMEEYQKTFVSKIK